MSYTSADVIYDPATHTSCLPDGRTIPHVTAVLSATGVSTDFAALRAGGGRIASAIDMAAARGTAVHADCHAYDDDDLDWNTVDSRVRPYVTAWVACRDAMGLLTVAHARERRIYHPTYHYTGILDGVFLRANERILLDIKTGDPEDAAGHLQTAAYEAGWNIEHPDEKIDFRWAVWLRPDRAVPYTIINYSMRADGYLDFAKFQACLTVYNEQPERRQRVSVVW